MLKAEHLYLSQLPVSSLATHILFKPNTLSQTVTLLTCIHEAAGCNLGQVADSFDILMTFFSIFGRN